MTQLTLFDPIEIPLTRGYVATVDPIDSDLAAVKWCARIDRQRIYAERHNYPGINRFLHREILERAIGRALTHGEYCDHINGDTMDNRRCNLRIATIAENTRNIGKRPSNTSGYKGVDYNKKRRKWRSAITVNYRKKHLGYFDTPEQAFEAYKAAALLYHGSFARLE